LSIKQFLYRNLRGLILSIFLKESGLNVEAIPILTNKHICSISGNVQGH